MDVLLLGLSRQCSRLALMTIQSNWFAEKFENIWSHHNNAGFAQLNVICNKRISKHIWYNYYVLVASGPLCWCAIPGSCRISWWKTLPTSQTVSLLLIVTRTQLVLVIYSASRVWGGAKLEPTWHRRSALPAWRSCFWGCCTLLSRLAIISSCRRENLSTWKICLQNQLWTLSVQHFSVILCTVPYFYLCVNVYLPLLHYLKIPM